MKKTTILLIMLSGMTFSQETYKIKGTIVDSKNNKVVGAKIELQDGTNTTTNFDGSFILNARSCYGSLKISFYDTVSKFIKYDCLKKSQDLNKILIVKK